ncbi:unnamed protein product [Callosobruchus maculatus]|uniref:Serpin domain-containing protein n=1 Tax=Callosobruchus maculatus TaxID=64391 RepID=A0A653CDS1_CALMS|nr:unnamed protein product [Callosobruchus maculatus]
MAVKVLLLLLCLNTVRSELHNHSDERSDRFYFTNKLIKTLLGPDHDWTTSVLVSPFAMEFGLGVIAFGSSGETLEEIKNAAGVHLLEKWSNHSHGYARRIIADMKEMVKGQVNVQLEASTVIAINSEYMPYRKYKDKALYWYNAEMQPLNFQWQELAANNLSDYISDHTSGRIRNLVQLGDIDQDAPMLVASYLDACVKWANRFDEEETVIERFYGLGGKRPLLHVMKGIFFANVSHNPDLRAKILTLPLQGGNLSMTFVLPDKRDGMPDLLQKLIDDTEILWNPERNTYKYVPVYVLLPKIRLESSIDGKKVLRQMGVNKVFEPDAELEQIAEGANLHLSQIRQKSVMDFDEWGVNSAAGTKVMNSDNPDSARAQPEVRFKADHPFVFTMTIRPRNDVLYFGLYGG